MEIGKCRRFCVGRRQRGGWRRFGDGMDRYGNSVSDSLRSACKVDTDNIEGCRGDTPVDLKMLISPKCFAAGRYSDCRVL